MKKLITLFALAVFTIGLYAQPGISTFKYEIRAPAIRIGGATKVKLDSIVQNVDTIKFYTGGTELKSNGSGIWTGSGIRLDTTLARVTLGIDQVPNLSQAAMFNDPIFTGVTYFGHSIVPTTPGTGYIGTSTSPVAALYLGATSPLSWGNSVFLTGGTGQVTLSGGNLNLGANNLLGSGSIGLTESRFSAGYFTNLTVTNAITGSVTGNAATVSNYTPAGGSITLSGADAITFNTTAATSITLPTSGTLLTDVVLSGYAPLADANFTGDHTTATVFRPATDGGASLGIYGSGWNNLFMSRGSRIYFDSDTTFGKLYFDWGDLHLDAHLDLGDNDLFLNGGIGSDDRKVLEGKFRYLTVDTLLPYSIGTPDMVAGYGYFGAVTVDSITINNNIENYSTENYGSTGTGNIVLSIGATLTTVNITDVIKLTPTASPPSGATEGMIYADTDHHLYYYNGTSWVSMTD